MPTYSIPDDGTMEAALYGSAHIETVLARENGDKLRRVFDERIGYAMASLDLELVDIVLSEAPFLIESDEPLDPQRWPATSWRPWRFSDISCVRSSAGDWSDRGWMMRTIADVSSVWGSTPSEQRCPEKPTATTRCRF